MNLATLHWPLLLFALGALAIGSISLWLPGEPRTRGTVLLGIGFGALTLEIAARWMETGRLPVIGAHENAAMASWWIAAVALTMLLARLPGHLPVVRLLAPSSAVVGAYGLAFSPNPIPAGAASRSVVGYVHALAGWMDFAVLLAATAAAIAVLIWGGRQDKALESTLSRLLGLGFALLTATIASGSLYSYIVFSEWYRWQMVEAFSAAAWAAYGVVLHARMMFGWRGRRGAWAALAVVPLMLGAFWVWSVFPDTYHYFERVLYGA